MCGCGHQSVGRSEGFTSPMNHAESALVPMPRPSSPAFGDCSGREGDEKPSGFLMLLQTTAGSGGNVTINANINESC